MASIHDIAERSGFSIGTVSRALTGKPDISDKARRKILRVVKETGYVPRGPKANRDVFAVPASLDLELRDNFATWFYEGMYRASFRHEYDVVLLPYPQTDFTSDELLVKLMSRGIRGLIMPSIKALPEIVSDLVAHNISVVTSYREPDQTDIGCVRYDFFKAFYQAIYTLVEHGYQEIALVTQSAPHDESARIRLEAYRQAMQDARLEPWEINCDGLSEEMQVAMFANLLRDHPGPFGIMGLYSHFIRQLYRAFELLEIHPDGRVGIIATDDHEYLRYFSPPVSAIVTPISAMGAQAVDLLVEMMNGGKPRDIVLESELKIRRSLSPVKMLSKT